MKKTQYFALPLSLALTLNSAVAAALSNPPSKSPLFSSESVIQLEMAADFVKIRKAADGGFWGGSEDPNTPETRATYYTTMYLRDPAHPERAFQGEVRARGMSSLTPGESDFPKLKVEIQDSEDLKGTLFQGSRNFRVNTHLSTNPENERSVMGRVFGDNGPMREGLAYRLAEALGIKTPATRLARIKYADYGTKTSFTRSALLIETDKKVAERLGGVLVDDYTMSELDSSGIDPVEGALFHVFHKIIGNDDVQLRVNEQAAMSTEKHRSIFNAMVVELPNKKRLPIVYDLDMCTFVAGYSLVENGLYNSKEFSLNTHESSLFTKKFLELRMKFTQEQLTKAITIVKSKKELLYQVVQNTPVDKDGRQNALKHLDTFFANIDSIMKIPMIAQHGVQFYSDSKKAHSILPPNLSDEPGTLRPGTPVAVLAKEGNMLKVAILDVKYDLPNHKKYIGYIDANTKISTILPNDLVAVFDDRDMGYGGGE